MRSEYVPSFLTSRMAANLLVYRNSTFATLLARIAHTRFRSTCLGRFLSP